MNDVQIQRGDFDVAVEYQRLCDAADSSGAVVFFVGLVRELYENLNEDRVDYLELEHYPGMTELSIQAIVDEAREQFPFEAVKVIHRVGRIYANQQIVLVAISSRHRDNAFKAAQFIMDFLKTRAPLWKKEVGSKGGQWLGTKQGDRNAAQLWTEQTEAEQVGPEQNNK